MGRMGAQPDYAGVNRVISGGQTGVDRAALDTAILLGVRHGGWCPRGRLAEDGTISRTYELRETESAEYPFRTEQNVIDSDGTLILYRTQLTGGTELTYRLARKHAKPHLLVDLEDPGRPHAPQSWFQQNMIQVLNVAGPRESSAPGIAKEAAAYLESLLRLCIENQTR